METLYNCLVVSNPCISAVSRVLTRKHFGCSPTTQCPLVELTLFQARLKISPPWWSTHLYRESDDQNRDWEPLATPFFASQHKTSILQILRRGSKRGDSFEGQYTCAKACSKERFEFSDQPESKASDRAAGALRCPFYRNIGKVFLAIDTG